jgi:hypothetical protein
LEDAGDEGVVVVDEAELGAAFEVLENGFDPGIFVVLEFELLIGSAWSLRTVI